MHQIVLKNKRDYDGPGIYIGRPSPYGNPWRMKTKKDRKEVVELYRQALPIWFEENPTFRQAIQRLIDWPKDLVLVCWCTPLECHGDALIEFIIQKRKEKESD